MEEDEEPTHKEVVETELAMRSGFGVSWLWISATASY